MILILFLQLNALAGTLWPDLSSPPKNSAEEQIPDAALIVAIEDYAFVSDIPGAQQNARDWYQWLTKTQGIPVSRVAMLENEKATKESILKEAKRLSSSTTDGKLWFVFVGHGAPAPDGRDGLLLGSDVQQTADSLGARGVSQEELLGILEENGSEVVAIIDACFSGRSSDGQVLVTGLQPLIATTDLNVGSSIVLSAAKHDEFAGPLPGTERPAFSYLALGALQGWGDINNDGKVSPDEVVQYSKDTMLGVLFDRTQTPNIRGENTDTTLSQSYEKGPDIAQIRYELTPISKDYFKMGLASSKASMISSIVFFGVGIGIWQSAEEIEDDALFEKKMRTGDTIAATGIGLFLGGGTVYLTTQIWKKVMDNRKKDNKG